jgi:preprotein translocase subunit SecG
MGSQTAFGPRGTATALSRLTTWCAIIFMITSISLTIFAGRNRSNSVMDNVKSPQSAPAKK